MARAWVIIPAALLAELVVLAAGLSGQAPLAVVLGGHGVVLVLMAIGLRRAIATGSDGGVALVGLIATLVAGPFGAAATLLLPPLVRHNATSEARLAAWYRRIALSAEQDEFTQLSDRIAIGRAANLAAPAPQVFADVFRGGSLSRQQAALGMIARAFHPGYLPVLKIALDSPEPMIRVQAAAVAARVRPLLQTQVAALFDRAADPTLTPAAATSVAADIKAALTSGLLEEAVRARAASIHSALQARTFAHLDAQHRATGAGASQRVTPQATSPEVADAYAAHLLAQGRFDEFRALRLSLRRPRAGRYRQRIVCARPASVRLRAARMTVRP